MPHSLRAKLSGLRYKGILEDKDYKRLCHALDLEKAEQDKCKLIEELENMPCITPEEMQKCKDIVKKYMPKQEPTEKITLLGGEQFVSIETYQQVCKERDIAIEQLHELGYELGQKIEQCDDAVSRQNIIEQYNSCADMLSDEELEGANLVMEWVYNAPAVKPQEPKSCEKCLYAEETDGSHCYECVKGESKFEPQ